MQKKDNAAGRKILAGITFLCGVLLIASCATGRAGQSKPLKLVDQVDSERYLGRWYEIARFQHGFEKNIVGATAEYSLRPDGKIQVVNSGFKKTLDGKYSEVRATAWIPDPSKPGALKVKFFNLFTSDYLIFGLDQENYSWALVGNNSRKFLWFLARTPEISQTLYNKMKALAEAQGFDTSELYRVPQKAR